MGQQVNGDDKRREQGGKQRRIGNEKTKMASEPTLGWQLGSLGLQFISSV